MTFLSKSTKSMKNRLHYDVINGLDVITDVCVVDLSLFRKAVSPRGTFVVLVIKE